MDLTFRTKEVKGNTVVRFNPGSTYLKNILAAAIMAVQENKR